MASAQTAHKVAAGDRNKTMKCFADVLGEIEKLSSKSPDGFTTQEMIAVTGHGEDWCRQRIKALMRAGKLKFNGNRRITRIDGLPGFSPVYKFIK